MNQTMTTCSTPRSILKGFSQSNFSEGLYIDYMPFDCWNNTPRFEFGYGLSYSSFSYSNLTVSGAGASMAEYPPNDAFVHRGGHLAPWETLWSSPPSHDPTPQAPIPVNFLHPRSKCRYRCH